ncbi:hypothetical protein [Corynebacterium spheniscorum]|uniref:biotin synthase auxiliary protein BsaP n=1 Tax=Corynebacterium spheniscorum TaxID=185761 RepID=UPI000A86CF6F|nr:hypothetical protein [Corynebacterium spheniscorum]KAA8718599.1 hypothetical protein F4V56_10730 [Corynebacterium spheniscorum]
MSDLFLALYGGQPWRFHPNTGQDLEQGAPRLSPSAQAGLEAPRYCPLCGRRMVVQVRPEGWSAQCSRHGKVDSSEAER